MPIPVPSIQADSFEQANPFLAGLSRGQNIYSQMVQNQYLPDQLSAQLKKQQLDNKIQQSQAQYAPQMTLADLFLKQQQGNQAQAQVPYMKSETAKNYAGIPLLQAQAQYEPYKDIGSYNSGLGRLGQANYFNSGITQLARFINTPEMQSLIHTNPDVGKQVTQALQGVSNRSSQGLNQQTPMTLSVMQNGLRKLVPSQNYGIQQQSPNQELSNINPSDVDAIREAAGDKFLKNTRTTQQLNQIQYGGVLDKIFNQADMQLPYVSQYSGINGMTKMAFDKLKSGMGYTTPEYSQYLNFTRNTAKDLSTEIGRILGTHATDQQRKEMNEIANPVSWDSNPEQTIKTYNNLKDIVRNITPAIISSPSESLNTLKEYSSENKNIGSYVKIKTPNGRIASIPYENLDKAIKLGGKRVD